MLASIKFESRTLKTILSSVIFVFFLFSCSGDGSTVDSTAPAVRIAFPPAMSATEANSIIVRGTANKISVVRVNGIEAISTDNFSTWQATVALVPGLNTLTVETGDINGNVNMAAASVKIVNINGQQPVFLNPLGVVLDSENNRALVIDTGLDALVAVDLSSGARTIVSNNNTPDAVNTFDDPRGVVLDSTNNRALVVDAGLDA